MGSGWYSLWARKGTSAEAIQTVNHAVNQALIDPKLQPKWAELLCNPTRARRRRWSNWVWPRSPSGVPSSRPRGFSIE